MNLPTQEGTEHYTSLKAVENKKVKKYKLDEETRPGQQAATDQEL